MVATWLIFFLSLFFARVKGESCNGSVVGRVTNPELNELSGLVESRRYSDVFYSIEDSGNGNSVYAISKNGTVVGEITLEDVRNYDFEDIALSSGTKNGDDLIFVGDIGNDWPNHCQGVNQTKRMVHVFSEPDLNEYRISGRITVPKKNITTLVLEDPDRLCGEDAKEDTEAMFIDPIYNVGYIIQKVRPRNEIKTPVIFKFDIPLWKSGKKVLVQKGKWVQGIPVVLERVGSIPLLSGIDDSFRNSHLANLAKIWPTFITGGDISRDGKTITLRSHNGVREWSRNTTSRQLVEDVLTQQRGKTIPVCHEAQGESIAISHDGVGFYTVSEAKGEDKSGTKIDIPMYYYSFSKDKDERVSNIQGSCVPIRKHLHIPKWITWCQSNCGKPPGLHPACIGNGVHAKCKCSVDSSASERFDDDLNSTNVLPIHRHPFLSFPKPIASNAILPYENQSNQIVQYVPLGNKFNYILRTYRYLK